MKVEIVSITVRRRKGYYVPAKYSSATYTQLYIDGESKGEYHNSVYGGFKKLLELLKKKYNFTDFDKKNGGSQNRD